MQIGVLQMSIKGHYTGILTLNSISKKPITDVSSKQYRVA